MMLKTKDSHDPFSPVSLGLKKGDRVAVAMSGGVDSSVVAALMHKSGFEVIGLTMRLYDSGSSLKNKKACCAGQDIYDAKNVALQLGFSHYILDYESNFKQGVIDNFVDSYMKGHTPIPCIRCNQTVKFSDLLKKAKEVNAKALCTGHYVGRSKYLNSKSKTSYHLKKALDNTKDQSYFLFTTTNSQLEYLRFPLGELPKTKVREHAKNLGLDIAEKPDSQDICFVPNGNYGDVIKKINPFANRKGKIIDYNTGIILGEHQGTISYTIGQRKGIGISTGKPAYVISINPDDNTILIGDKENLKRNIIILEEVNFLNFLEDNPSEEITSLPKDLITFLISTNEIPQEESKSWFYKPWFCLKGIKVRIRSNGEEIPAKIFSSNNFKQYDESIKNIVVLEKSEYSIAPGQACVFYDNNCVLGGGWIKKSLYMKNISMAVSKSD